MVGAYLVISINVWDTNAYIQIHMSISVDLILKYVSDFV